MLRLFAWAAAVLAVLLLSLGYTIVTGGGQPDATPTPGASGSPEASPTGSTPVEPTPTVGPTPSTTPAASSSGSTTSFEIRGHEFAFDPSAITVSAAGSYTVTFANDGTIPHNVTFADGTTVSAQPGETATVVVNVPAGGIDFICSLPGHADAGMTGSVTVGGG